MLSKTLSSISEDRYAPLPSFLLVAIQTDKATPVCLPKIVTSDFLVRGSHAIPSGQSSSRIVCSLKFSGQLRRWQDWRHSLPVLQNAVDARVSGAIITASECCALVAAMIIVLSMIGINVSALLLPAGFALAYAAKDLSHNFLAGQSSTHQCLKAKAAPSSGTSN